MLKKHMAACLVATAFVAAPALAQTSTAPASGQPATTAPSSQPSQTTSTSSSSSMASGQFMTEMKPQQIRASKLVGVDIVGANNESIGDVNDLILDQQGMPEAVVIGVGGFLGIGEKNVAVPFKAVEWKWERREAATTAGTRTDNTAPPRTTAGTGAAGSQPAGSTTATTGSTGTATGTNTAARTDANRGAPDHGILRMTKADLQNAPSFSYDGDRNANRGSGTGTSAPATAPKQ